MTEMIYVLFFCQKRGIRSEGAAVVMKTSKNPEIEMIEKISFKIQLLPEFLEKYKRAVIKAAHIRSVKEHILNPPVFEVKAKIGA